MLAPAGTPPEALAGLREGFAEARRSPELRARIGALGYAMVDDDGAAFAQRIGDDLRAARAVLSTTVGSTGKP